MLAGRVWAEPGNGATPAVPGGGNPHANSGNAATPAVPGGGNDKDKKDAAEPAPPATTPSGVTPAQPGGGNPNSNSGNSATPASPANKPNFTSKGKFQPHIGDPAADNAPAPQPALPSAGGSYVPAPAPSPVYDPNAGTLFPGGATSYEPVIPAFQPRPMPPRQAGTPPVTARFSTPCISSRGSVLASGGRWILLPVSSRDEILVLNADTNELISRVKLSSGPVAIAVARNGKTAWVACHNASQVIGVDLSTLATGPVITVGARPSALELSPDGRNLFVANSGDGTLSIIDTNRAEVVGVIPVGPAPQDVLVSRNGHRVYVINSGDSSVTVLDPDSRRVLTTIKGR
jgi:YVTN family beta-propeller protein